jgi:hypothetical protein
MEKSQFEDKYLVEHNATVDSSLDVAALEKSMHSLRAQSHRHELLTNVNQGS